MGKVSGYVVLVLLLGVLALGQNGTSFSSVNSPQSQVPAQDNSATPANSTNPAASTLPVPPSARVNGAPATSSESPANTAPPANSPANATPGNASSASTSGRTSSGANPAAGSASGSTPGNNSGGSQPVTGSYARPLAGDVDVQIPANTEMRAMLDTPLSTRTSKAGDRFSATVVDSVRGSNGSVAIPLGTRLEGEVTDATAGKVKPTETTTATSALKGKGKLSLRFRDAVLPNGQTVPLTTSLVSVNSTGAKALKQSGISKDVGVSTTSGSTFGGPLRGFAIGTLAGGGYILAIRSKDVDLPAQTGMVIRFDQPTQQ